MNWSGCGKKLFSTLPFFILPSFSPFLPFYWIWFLPLVVTFFLLLSWLTTTANFFLFSNLIFFFFFSSFSSALQPSCLYSHAYFLLSSPLPSHFPVLSPFLGTLMLQDTNQLNYNILCAYPYYVKLNLFLFQIITLEWRCLWFKKYKTIKIITIWL